MKTISALLLAYCSALTAFGQHLTLNGALMTDGKEPVPETRISVHGIENKTDLKGQFKIVLSGDFSEGDRVTIKVIKPGWAINYPLDGEWNLPNFKLQNIQTLDVIIVPRGSKALWTHKRIETYIARLSDNFTKQKGLLSAELAQARTANTRLQEEARPAADFSEYLDRWAREFGQTPEQVRTAFDEWAKATEHSDDYRLLGLRQFYLKKFAAAADNFVKAALRGEERVKRAEERLEKERLETYEDWKLAGNAQYNDYNFREAISSYERAAKHVTKERLPQEWAETKNLLGNARVELGTRVEGQESQSLLGEAVAAYRAALEVFARERSPQDWAMIQNNLGVALISQGERAGDKDSMRLLAESVTTYRKALEVYSRGQFPQEWALTQSNLGIALMRQGERAGGDASLRMLADAVTAYNEALKFYSFEESPQDWAATQINLGAALMRQGERAGGEKSVRMLAASVTAYRKALEVYTQKELPQDWALTQSNLGNVLLLQGERADGEASVRLLGEAVAAQREALKVYTQKELPQDWALTQNNLGVALSSQGERAGGEKGLRLLGEAVAAFDEALKVYSIDHLPHDWAQTQNNLGTALMRQCELLSGEESLRLLAKAIAAFREALRVYSIDQLPHGWAQAQNNLGSALITQAERLSGEESLRRLAEAVTALRKALGVYSPDLTPLQWAETQNNLGVALRSRGERSSGGESLRLFAEAVAAHREALKVYISELSAFGWASAQNNLGRVLTAQGERSTGGESARLLGEAVTAYREALTVFTREQLPQYWAMTQNNLGKAYSLLKNWKDAAVCFENVLTLYPDYEESYLSLASIYHERLFEYAKAFELHQKWLSRFPQDTSALADFAEAHFTTGRFPEFPQRIKPLLADPEHLAGAKIALRMIEVANLLALDNADRVPAALAALHKSLSDQKADFRINWSFNGTLNFINRQEKFASYRPWLNRFFSAAKEENRDAIVKALREAQAQFPAMNSGQRK
jgi:tetratricopeptide (TPR) repeat protein